MEYSVSLERKKRSSLFIYGVALTIFLIIGAFFFLGIYGIIGLTSLFLFIAITPLFFNKYRFFLILWLFVVPLFDSFRGFMIAGTYPQVYIMTGLTIPFATMLFINEIHNVIKKYPFVIYLIGFFFIMLINFFRPGSYLGNIVEVLKVFIQIFIICCVYKFLLNKEKLKGFIKLILIFIILNSTVAILQRITGIGLPIIEGVPRVVGLSGHPNVLAFIMIMYFPFAVHFLLKSQDKKARIWWIISILLCVLTLFLTLCKTVIFTFFVQVFILFFFVNIKTKTKIVFLILGGAILFVAGDYLLNLNIIDLIIERIYNTSSLEWRFKAWEAILRDINISNVWFGHGIDTVVLQVYKTFGGANVAHNGYLQLLYEVGIVGLTLFILPFFIYSWKYIKSFFNEKTSYKIHYMLPLLIVLAFLINMFFDNNAFLRTVMNFLWFFLILFHNELEQQDTVTNELS